MKLEILQEDLSKVLSIVSRFVAVRSQLPILGNLLFSAEDKNLLKVVATNLEVGIQYWIGAKIEESGVLAIPSKELAEFVSYLSPGKLILESKKKTQLLISSSSGETVFSGMDGSEFPKIPTLDSKKAVVLPTEGLAEAITKVGFASSEDESRPVLGSIYWRFNKNGYRMVGTDGYRLSLKDVVGIKTSMGDKEEETVFLIPTRTLTEIIRLMNNDSEVRLDLTGSSNQAVFAFGDLQLASRLMEGDFPDYEKIIPDACKSKITLDKNEFYQAVKIASVFARESSNIVKFDFSKDGLVISANASTVGENKTRVSIKIEGEPIKIAFNYKFVLDFLNAIENKEEEIILELGEPLSPAVFKIASDPSWLHLIMPVRVDL